LVATNVDDSPELLEPRNVRVFPCTQKSDGSGLEPEPEVMVTVEPEVV
jgi:hypothetical protein